MKVHKRNQLNNSNPLPSNKKTHVPKSGLCSLPNILMASKLLMFMIETTKDNCKLPTTPYIAKFSAMLTLKAWQTCNTLSVTAHGKSCVKNVHRNLCADAHFIPTTFLLVPYAFYCWPIVLLCHLLCFELTWSFVSAVQHIFLWKYTIYFLKGYKGPQESIAIWEIYHQGNALAFLAHMGHMPLHTSWCRTAPNLTNCSVLW